MTLTTGATVNVKTGVAGVIAVFVVFYIVTAPDSAAHISHSSLHFFTNRFWPVVVDVANGIRNFLTKVTS